MSSEIALFPISAILTVLSGQLLCSIDDLYAIIGHMVGRPVFTHELGSSRVLGACAAAIATEHPDLAQYNGHTFDGMSGNPAAIEELVKRLGEQHGTHLAVSPLEGFNAGNPIDTFAEMAGEKPVVIVKT